LRHTAATAIRRRDGIETARTVLGHACVDVTEVYAERDLERAARIVEQVG
jgi:integrase